MASNGMASGIKMVSGVVRGITRNAAIAFGANSEKYDKQQRRVRLHRRQPDGSAVG